MTWLDVLLYGPGWLACLLIPINWLAERRFRRRYEKRWGQPPLAEGECEAVITRPQELTEAEYEELKDHWRREYGNGQSVNHGKLINDKEQP